MVWGPAGKALELKTKSKGVWFWESDIVPNWDPSIATDALNPVSEGNDPKSDIPVPGHSLLVSFSKIEYVVPLKETAAQAPSNWVSLTCLVPSSRKSEPSKAHFGEYITFGSLSSITTVFSAVDVVLYMK
jgi:hypothetical protein